MSDTGWTTVGTLPAGSLFETRDGSFRFFKTCYPAQPGDRENTACWSLRDGDQFDLRNDTTARPLTPVAVAPSLPTDLKPLLLGALATGATDPLEDYLLERRADPDVRRAVRENARRELAKEVVYQDDARPGFVGVRLSDDLIKLAGLWPPG